jgi:hypothetical protein
MMAGDCTSGSTTLAPNAACRVHVQFVAGGTGTASAALTVSAASGGSAMLTLMATTCPSSTACNPANPCHVGMLSCSTGACTDTGANVTDQTACGTGMVCVAGTCHALPTLVSSNPANGATGVNPMTSILLTFSQAIDPTSVTSTSLKLQTGGADVAVQRLVSGATVTLTPTAAMKFGAAYRVTVAATVADLTGSAIGQAATVDFTTRDRAVGSATRVDGGGADVANYDLKVDGIGNAVVVWEQQNSVSWNRWASGSNTWLGAALLETDTATSQVPTVAFDGTGRGVALWWRGSTVTGNMPTADAVARRYNQGAWQPPASMTLMDAFGGESFTADPDSHNAAMSGDLAVFNLHHNGGPYPISFNWTNGLAVPPQSQRPALYYLVQGTTAAAPSIVLGVFGGFTTPSNMIGVWTDHYDPAMGWNSPTMWIVVTTTDATETQRALIGSDSQGRALAVSDFSGTLQAEHATPAGVFGATETVTTTSAKLDALAVGANAHAVVLFTSGGKLFAEPYDPVAGWGASTMLSPANVPVLSSTVFVDGDGNALAAWADPDGTVHTARFRPSTGWSASQSVPGSGFSTADHFRSAGLATGEAVITWLAHPAAGAVVQLMAASFE